VTRGEDSVDTLATGAPGLTGTGPPLLRVDISDLAVTDDREAVLITYSLGSCVGLTLYDATAGVGGMIHCLLPLSRIDPKKAAARPAMFVDTGVPELLRRLYALGARRERLVAKVAGAGSPLGPDHTFKIGQRNYTVLRKILWKNGILIRGEDVGGRAARTLVLEMKTGRTTVRMEGREVEL